MRGLAFFDRTSLSRRYVEMWTDDLPPLGGILRFFFYTGLLALAVYNQKSPIRGIELYAQTDPTLFRPYGLLELLGVPYISPEIIRFIIGATVVAWVCAAVGFLSRASAIVTACGATFLHGMFLGSNALNHNWFFPVHALILICFARSNDRWSVDYHLMKHRRGGPPSTQSSSVADTGLARKAVLVAAVGFYFAAGITKLMVAGPQWADGHTVAYFAAERGVVTPLGSLVASHLGLCAAFATASMVLEVGAFVALLSKRLRGLMLAGWTAMHLGIWLTMAPDYWENIVCFSLLIDWRGVIGKFPRPASLARPTADVRAVNASHATAQSHKRAALGASLLLTLFGAVALCQIFWWPLTHVYMYSSYFSMPRNVRADHPADAFERADAVQALARGYLEEQPPIEATQYMCFRTRLRLTGPGLESHYVRTPPGTASWKQWVLTVVRPVLIRDLAAKPDGDIAFVPGREDYPAQRFLRDYVTLYKRSVDEDVWRDYSRLEITYRLKDAIPIASVPLDGE
jgi:hypothetical protein